MQSANRPIDSVLQDMTLLCMKNVLIIFLFLAALIMFSNNPADKRKTEMRKQSSTWDIVDKKLMEWITNQMQQNILVLSHISYITLLSAIMRSIK